MKQTDFLVYLPVVPNRLEALRQLLLERGDELRTRLAAIDRFHFASLFVVHDNPAEPGPPGAPYLGFEGNVDGDARTVLGQLINTAGELLREIFSCCGLVEPSDNRLLEQLWASHLALSNIRLAGFLRRTGLINKLFYVSLPGMSLPRIRDEARLRARIENLLDARREEFRKLLPADIRERVRRQIDADAEFLWSARVPPEPWHRRHWSPLDRVWGWVRHAVEAALNGCSRALDLIEGGLRGRGGAPHTPALGSSRQRKVSKWEVGPEPVRWGYVLYWFLIDLLMLGNALALLLVGAAAALIVTGESRAAGDLVVGSALAGLLVGGGVAAVRLRGAKPTVGGVPIRFGPEPLWKWFDPPFLAFAVSVVAAGYCAVAGVDAGAAAPAVTIYGLAGGALLLLLGAGRWVRGLEIRDAASADVTPPPQEFVWADNRREAANIQNHLVNIAELKSHPLRRVLVLAVLLNGILRARLNVSGRNVSGIPSLHFVRWVVVPANAGSRPRRRLLFLSNYDGGWETYLGEFVDHAGHRLSGLWSNTRHSPGRDFPETVVLWWQGAHNEIAFKRYSRNTSYDATLVDEPTIPDRVNDLFWYRAYPQLTVENIHTNKLIREMLYHRPHCARTAQAWLALL